MRRTFLLILIFLVGCASPAVPGQSPTNDPNLSGSASATVPPPTATALPPTVTPSPVITTTPIYTPFPTFSLDDGPDVLRDWVEGLSTCLLPCWGDIQPGETTWPEVRQIVEQISGVGRVNLTENANCEFGSCNGIAWSLFPVTVAEGTFYSRLDTNTVHLISILVKNKGSAQKLNLLKHIGLHEIFRLYGLPNIFLMTIEPGPTGNPLMELVLVYPERQSIIKYVKEVEVKDGNYENCGKDEQVEMVILDTSVPLTSIEAINAAPETRTFGLTDRYRPVADVVTPSINTMFQGVSADEDFCVATPTSFWNP